MTFTPDDRFVIVFDEAEQFPVIGFACAGYAGYSSGTAADIFPVWLERGALRFGFRAGVEGRLAFRERGVKRPPPNPPKPVPWPGESP